MNESGKRMHFQNAAMAALVPAAQEALKEIPEIAVVSVVVTWANLDNSSLPFGFVMDRNGQSGNMSASDILRTIRQTTRLLQFLFDSYEKQVVAVVQAGERVSQELKQLEKLKEKLHDTDLQQREATG